MHSNGFEAYSDEIPDLACGWPNSVAEVRSRVSREKCCRETDQSGQFAKSGQTELRGSRSRVGGYFCQSTSDKRRAVVLEPPFEPSDREKPRR